MKLSRLVLGLTALALGSACIAQQIQWLPAGPAPQSLEGTNVSGRVLTIAISPNFDGHGHPAMFLGTYGGVWRSANFTSANPTWQPLTDQLNVPALSKVGLITIQSLAVDANNPQRIFAGAGVPGQGVLRSLDGGNTWSLEANATFSASGAYPISKILVDPTDKSGQTLYVSGGPLGFYKSTDGGTTWTAMITGLAAGRVSDVDYTVSASNALTLYIGLAYATDGLSQGVWASTDSAASWTHLTTNLVDLNTGLPTTATEIGPIKLAADHRPGAPAGVFAALGDRATGHASYLLNVLRFTGPTSTGTAAGGNLPVPNKIFNQGVNLPISVSPSGLVYLGTAAHVLPFVSSDNGAHWQQLNSGSNNVTPHVDDWSWAFWGNDVYSGNDGGIWRFDSVAQNWVSLNTPGLQTNMVNGVSPHPVYPNVFLIGSQDNETAFRLDGSWKTSLSGGPADGGAVLFDPTPTNIDNYAYTNGPPDPNPKFLFQSHGLNATAWNSIGFLNDNLVPFSSLFSIVPSDTRQLLVPLGQVFRTPDRGTTWGAISPVFISKTTTASAIANSTDGQTIYVSYGAQLFRTVNGGGDASASNWPSVAITLTGRITSIAVNPLNASNVVIATNAGEIMQTTDGDTWSNITGNFPPVQTNAIVIKTDTGSGGATIFLGTTIGVFALSQQGGTPDWEPFGTGLPNVNVTDLHYNTRTKYLVAGTFGRGVFVAYLHFTTNLSLGATSLGQKLYIFGTGNAGDIELNQAALGQAFSGWFDVQGGKDTDAAPTATGIQKTIFCFVKGLDSQIYVNQAGVGAPFGNWFVVPGGRTTDQAPAATSLDNNVFVFAKGLDSKIYFNHATLGDAFTGWSEVGGNGQTDRSPSVASNGKTLFVFVKGLDNQVRLNKADFGQPFGNWFPVPGGRATDESPASTVVEQSLFVFIKGLDGHIYLNQAPLGGAFSGWFEVQGGMQTNESPVAATVGQTVFVFVRGLDGHIYVNQAGFGHSFGNWFEVGGGFQ